VIVLRPGAQAAPQDIRQFAKERLADFKVPQFIKFRDEPLPRNPGGKVLKPDLRKETEWGDQLR
jgi:acyl-CoA synthetase (AMP-forming)/AMP-acid ligase II